MNAYKGHITNRKSQNNNSFLILSYKPKIAVNQEYPGKRILKVAERIPPCVKDVAFDVHPKSKEQVNNYRGSHGD